MSDYREPLGSLSLNVPRRPLKRLAPIFTKPLVHPPLHTPPSSSNSSQKITSSPPHRHHSSPQDEDDSGPSRKRVKRSSSPFQAPEDGERREHERMSNFFVSTPPSRYTFDGCGRIAQLQRAMIRAREEPVQETVWRRPRRRLGVAGIMRECTAPDMAKQRFIAAQPPYLSTLVTSLAAYHPLVPPSSLLLPSIHPPTGRPRDFAPPLSVAFNHIAKHWDASEARSTGLRRLVAVAGEEGGVRILDVDEGLGSHREEKGFWWRAHSNAVFDVKWSADDRRVLTASGDQTTRLHALSTPTPTLLATLRGHTSSVKAAVFFDPSRSHGDPSVASSVVASCSRDGNILIYDLRCQGRMFRDGSEPTGGTRRRSTRDRYSAGVPGFAAQQTECNVDPVMVVRQAHGDGSRRTSSGRTAVRSVTSLIALQSMPGILASGGSSDGIVKLWDLRFPASSARSPYPRPTCNPFGELPDPTIRPASRSRRPRSINALVESPISGDIYALCGDSKVHVLRPSAFSTIDEPPHLEAIQPKTFTHPNLLVSSFYIRMAISPDGRYLSSGSCKGGVMTWDIEASGNRDGEVDATRLSLGMGGVAWPDGKEREVSAVDWGKDLLAACADDLATRIYRPNREAARYLFRERDKAGQEWAGIVEP